MKKTDKELVVACQKHNDLKAFEILIKRHQNKVRAIVFKFTNNPEDLNDISQEVFIKAFRSIKKYRGDASFSTWLYRITINTCKDTVKRQNIHSQKVVNIEDKSYKEIPDMKHNDITDNIRINKEQKLVLEEIKKLPESQRLALILHDIEELSYKEISHIANCPVGTVKSRLFNARKALKQKLKSLITTIQVNQEVSKC